MLSECGPVLPARVEAPLHLWLSAGRGPSTRAPKLALSEAEGAGALAQDDIRDRGVVNDVAAETVWIKFAGHRWEMIPPSGIDVTAGRHRKKLARSRNRFVAVHASFSEYGEAYEAALACSTSRCRSTRRSSLPVGVRGSSLTITISRGSL